MFTHWKIKCKYFYRIVVKYCIKLSVLRRGWVIFVYHPTVLIINCNIDTPICFHAKPKNSRKTPYLSYLTRILGIRCSHDYFHSSAWFHLFPGIRRFSNFSEIWNYRFVDTSIINFSFYFWFLMKTSESIKREKGKGGGYFSSSHTFILKMTL